MFFRDNYSPLQGFLFIASRLFKQPASFLSEGMKCAYSHKCSAAKSERDKVLHHPHCCPQELLSSFVGLMLLSCPIYFPCPPCPVKIGNYALLLLADRDVRKSRFLFSFWVLVFEFGSFKILELPSDRRLAWLWDWWCQLSKACR